MELLAFQNHLFYPDYPCSTSIDPLFHHPANSDLNILPCSALPPPPPPPLDNSIPPQPFQYSYQYPKRQKCYEDEYYNYCYYPEEELMPSLKPDGFVANPPLLIPKFSLPEIYGRVVPAFDYGGCGDQEASGGGGRGSLSAQSIAARQRRRKITEKTQELGKLIPGGHKLNTAEMFHAASKYIKCLQAQVGILEFTGSAQENHEESLLHTRELQALASSPSIQEKLYSSDKCLVPKQFVDVTLPNYHDLQSNALISTELHQLMRTSSG
ncbi:transcription factor bHLH52-like [Rhododendron vialii]|uniref:transcription factor bHLH52-like n=1 Tax=Rhododendron vialii TaxID=182163 RepID=UPI00265FACA1|nr:transcription factor bHLH52-like [Rhododendron vialii]